MKIKAGQVWRDKKTGDIMRIKTRHHDVFWNCTFDRSIKNHKMNEFIIKKYYTPII